MEDISLQKKVVNHLKNCGFIVPSSEIYNGLANAWDLGPLGAVCSWNLKQLWLNEFVFKCPNTYLIDSNIIVNPTTWVASGHVKKFIDYFIDCKECKYRFRPDKLFNEQNIPFANLSLTEIEDVITKQKVLCPHCGHSNWTKPRKFNLLFQTSQNVVENQPGNMLYLRPETAQGCFINYPFVARTMRCKIPFGIAQIGKSFRNEITPGNFVFRTREFEQMEVEWFCLQKDALKYFEKFKKKIYVFLTKTLKISSEKICLYEQQKNELAHYAQKTIDFQFNFPHGWDELLGLSYRGDYDLRCHQTNSGVMFTCLDPATNQKILPHVIEPSFGLNRLMYAIFVSSFEEEQLSDGTLRTILKLPFIIAPYDVSVLPLVKKNNSTAHSFFKKVIAAGLKSCLDLNGSIGRRYRRQDAVGTPFCVTVDFDSMKKNNPTVTIRNRDTMKQIKCKTHLAIQRLFKLLKKE